MPFLLPFAIHLILDMTLFGVLTAIAGQAVGLANDVSMIIAGLGVMALGLTRPIARPAKAGLFVYLAWAVIAALAVSLLLNWLGVEGKQQWLAKGLIALIYAGLTPLVWRVLAGQRQVPVVAVAGSGLGALALGALTMLMPQSSAARDTGKDVQALYQVKRVFPTAPERVFHLGHSLVARDMPAMLAQLSGAGDSYNLQLGWGTSLKEHYNGTINGFAEENATPRYRDAHEALKSGEYAAFVLTEMVTLKDAIRYHDTTEYAAKWASEAVAGNPDIQLFAYETWHQLDAQPDWLTRLPGDLQLWQGALMWPAARATGKPVWLIPAGQVFHRVVAEAESKGIAEMTSRTDLFRLTPEGDQDQIHPNDLGNYLVALTHYAVLYGKSPVGLPHQLLRADGTPATAPSPELARRMQEIVWEVAREIPWTGVPVN